MSLSRSIEEYDREFSKKSRKEKKRDPLVSKKDLRKENVRFGLKLQVAKDLGLLDKVKKRGWSGLSAAETGRVGGYMSQNITSEQEAEDTPDPTDSP